MNRLLRLLEFRSRGVHGFPVMHGCALPTFVWRLSVCSDSPPRRFRQSFSRDGARGCTGWMCIYRFSTTGATLIGLDRSRVRSKHPRHFGAEYTYCSPQIYPLAKHALCFERIRSCFFARWRGILASPATPRMPGSSRCSSEVGGPISALWVRFACARSRRGSSVAGLPRFLPRWERTLSLRTSAL